MAANVTMTPNALARFLRGLSLFLFVMGVLALGCIPFAASRLRPLKEHGVQVMGVVKDRHWERRTGSTAQEEYLTYRFKVNGEDYGGEEHYDSGWNLRAGMPVSITYLPEHPQDNLMTVSALANTTRELCTTALLNWMAGAFFYALYRKLSVNDA